MNEEREGVKKGEHMCMRGDEKGDAGGLGLGLGLGGCLVLFALFMLFKGHSAKVNPDTGKVEA